jgi:hypothetical protein
LNLSSAVAKFFILAMSDPFAFSSSKMTLIGLGLSESTSFLPSEFKESMARKSNIIIFSAEESKKTESKERKVEDIAIVNELCKITGTNKQTVKNVTRLGKKDVDSDNPRPMRVIFEDEKAKGSLMANMKNCFPGSRL